MRGRDTISSRRMKTLHAFPALGMHLVPVRVTTPRYGEGGTMPRAYSQMLLWNANVTKFHEGRLR